MRVWFTNAMAPYSEKTDWFDYTKNDANTFVVTDTLGILEISYFGLEKLHRLSLHLETNNACRMFTGDSKLDSVDPNEPLEFINFTIVNAKNNMVAYQKNKYLFNNEPITRVVDRFNAKAVGLGLGAKIIFDGFGTKASNVGGTDRDKLLARVYEAPYINNLGPALLAYSDIDKFKCGRLLFQLGDHCLSNSTLSEIDFNENLVCISTSAFAFCKNLRELILPRSLRIFGKYAATSCTSLRYVELNEGLRYLDTKAFSRCANLREIKINSTIPGVFSEDAFSGCDIRKVHLAKSLNDNPQILRLLSEIKNNSSGPVEVILF